MTMRRTSQWVLAGLGLALLVWGAWALGEQPDREGVRATLSAAHALSGADTTGFARAMGPRSFEWPADHGPHPEYRTEWWYVTANLNDAEGRRFGLQLTFFRNALAPDTPRRESDWNTNQVWLAHAALTDVRGGRHLEAERVARGAAELAGGFAQPFRVWLDEWELRSVSRSSGPESPFPIELNVRTDEWSVGLTLESVKEAVLQGESGYSPKGPEPGNASYYYSYTRMVAGGRVEVAGERFQVEGLAWMDREWSTSALGPEHLGWDWFSLQLSDQRELMFFELRRRDGSPDPFDHGALVDPDGSTRPLGPDAVRIATLGSWESPLDGARYPSGWRLEAPALDIDLEVRPLVRDQEMNLTFRYWEGAVRVTGSGLEGPVEGRGYVELTGYGEEAVLPTR